MSEPRINGDYDANGVRIRFPWQAATMFGGALIYTAVIVIFAIRLEGRVNEMEHRATEFERQLQQIDTSGTRALGPTILRLSQQETEQASQNRRLDSLEAAQNNIGQQLAVIRDRQDQVRLTQTQHDGWIRDLQKIILGK